MKNVSVRLDDESIKWLDDHVKEGRFSSRGHGIRLALKELMKTGGKAKDARMP